MKDYNNSVIYVISIGKKRYVGSSANYKQRCSNYKSAFNKILKNIDDIKNDTMKSIKQKYNLSINTLLIKEFINEKTWSIKIYKYYSCENHIELKCEEERIRLKKEKNDKQLLNANVCINVNLVKYYKEEEEKKKYNMQNKKEECLRRKTRLKELEELKFMRGEDRR